jgi:type II secretory pathway component PulJ
MEEVPVEARALVDTMTSSLRSKRRTTWQPPATLPAGLWDTRRELMVVNEVVRWLHQHWDLTAARNQNPPGHDARARARLLAWRLVRPCLERYFQEEQDLLANLVRAVDALAKRVDALAADQARLLGAVRSDLVDAVAHCEEAISGLGGGA